jgi:hypothetical protein
VPLLQPDSPTGNFFGPIFQGVSPICLPENATSDIKSYDGRSRFYESVSAMNDLQLKATSWGAFE